MEYRSFKYIYPPRPSKVIPQEGIGVMDNGEYLAQPKLNGTCGEVYVNSRELKVMNRHATSISSQIDRELRMLSGGDKWNVYVGEYLNKSKKDANNRTFNHKFAMFDVLVLDGEHLVGTTFEERQKIIMDRLKPRPFDKWLSQISPNVFTINSFTSGFKAVYNEIIGIDMYEGLVFKKKNARLENGINRPGNTSAFQVKCRKPTKNYSY